MRSKSGQRARRVKRITLAAVAPLAMFGMSMPAAAQDDGRDFRAAPASATPVSDSYLVALKGEGSDESARVDEAEQLVSRYGGQVDYVFRGALHGFMVKIEQEQALNLAGDPAVDFVQQEGRYSTDALDDQPASGQQGPVPQAVIPSPGWALDRIDQRQLPLNAAYNGENSAHGKGAGATVYVFDTGINKDHYTFGDRVVADIDVSQDPDHGWAVGKDCQGHGTAAASLAAGEGFPYESGEGEDPGFGIARDAQIVNVKWLGYCTGIWSDEERLQALDVVFMDPARNSNSVASISGPLSGTYKVQFNNYLNQLINTGTAVVLSAGNDGSATARCADPAYANPNVIVVGATDDDDSRRADSNFGTCVDIWAPGTDVRAANHVDYEAPMFGNFHGTSAATPLVAGMAAVLTPNPALNPAGIKARLELLATDNALSDVTTNDRLLHVGGLYDDATDVPILDAPYTTFSHPLTVNDQANATVSEPLRVTLSIDHNERGQIDVDLIAPDGSVYSIINPSSDTGDDISGEFTVNATGEALNGNWRLKITDVEAGPTQTQKLQYWSLQV